MDIEVPRGFRSYASAAAAKVGVAEAILREPAMAHVPVMYHAQEGRVYPVLIPNQYQQRASIDYTRKYRFYAWVSP